MNQTPKYIAMWSTPRSVSTALMRAWENRADTIVADEPFNSFRSRQNNSPSTPIDWNDDSTFLMDIAHCEKIIATLTGPIPKQKSIYYQKHFAAHIPQSMNLDWMHQFTNCFLIRSPKEVIASYLKKWPEVNQRFLGFPKLLDLFHYTKTRTGITPPVIDAQDLQSDPRQSLQRLCDAINIKFSESMLYWNKGIRTTDGPWTEGKWYQEVAETTTFRPYQAKEIQLEAHLTELWEECEAVYQELYSYKL